MSGYQASPAALTDAAKGVADALAELGSIGAVGADSGRGVSGLALGESAVGHPGLASALGEFCYRWEWGVRGLVQAGKKIADRLNETGTAYQKAEHGVVGALKRAANDLVGDPRADSAHAQDASWEELARSQTPDYSAESWQRAGSHMADTWNAEGRDVAENSLPGVLARTLHGENPLQGPLDDVKGLKEIAD